MCLYISVWKYTVLYYCRPLPLITVFDVTLRNTLLISISFDLYSSNKTEILMKLFISFVYTNLYSRINCINHYAITTGFTNLQVSNPKLKSFKLEFKSFPGTFNRVVCR